MNTENKISEIESNSLTLENNMVSLLKMTNAFTMKLKQQSMEKFQ